MKVREFLGKYWNSLGEVVFYGTFNGKYVELPEGRTMVINVYTNPAREYILDTNIEHWDINDGVLHVITDYGKEGAKC